MISLSVDQNIRELLGSGYPDSKFIICFSSTTYLLHKSKIITVSKLKAGADPGFFWGLETPSRNISEKSKE